MKNNHVLGQDTLSVDDVEHSLGLPGTFALWLGANVVVTTILTGMFLVPDLTFQHAMLLIYCFIAVIYFHPRMLKSCSKPSTLSYFAIR